MADLGDLGASTAGQPGAPMSWPADARLPDLCVHQLFEEQARRSPDRTAIILGNRSLTYSELDARANQLAHRLCRMSVEAGSVVGIFMERGVEMAAAVLGVLKAGAAYQPLDPADPPARLAAMIGRSGASALITQPVLEPCAPAADRANVITIDPAFLAIDAMPTAAPPGEPRATDLAVVLHTSGSTGIPKGVLVDHGALPNACQWQAGLSVPRGVTRTLLFLSLAVSTATTEMFATWLGGGTLVLIPESRRRDLRWVLEEAGASSAERLLLPAAALRELVVTAPRPPMLQLRELVVTGDRFEIEPSTRSFFEHLDGCVLQHRYGSCETRTIAAFEQIGPPAEWVSPPPLGRPITNRRVHLLDEGLNPVEPGQPGEICVGGPGLASRYLNDPELTARRFVDHRSLRPGGHGSRVFRTGDMGRWPAGGPLEYLGRADDQVKIRGFRVSLGEVRSVLCEDPAVEDAAVLASGDASERRLVAYVAPRVGAPAPDAGRVRQRLRRRLPEHMIPSSFVALDTLPRTPTGKLDRTALRASPAAAQAKPPGSIGPRTSAERLLARIWASLLGSDLPIGVHDDFFDLGGNSLLAVRMTAEVEGSGSGVLPLAAMFDGPATIARLAGLMERASPEPRSRLRPGTSAVEGAAQELIPVRTSGSRPPLFVLLPHQPNLPAVRHLLGPLPADQPVFGLLPKGLGRHFPPQMSIPLLANRQLALLRSLQPEGPYHICGYSFAGLLAYELARQLQAGGDAVAFLALIDTMNPVSRRRLRRRELPRRLRRVVGRGPKGMGKELAKLLPAQHRSRGGDLNGVPDDFDLRGAVGLSRRYRVSGVETPLVLLVTRSSARRLRSPMLGWERVHLGPIERQEIPGEHLTVFDQPNVGPLAEALARSLRTTHDPPEAR